MLRWRPPLALSFSNASMVPSSRGHFHCPYNRDFSKPPEVLMLPLTCAPPFSICHPSSPPVTVLTTALLQLARAYPYLRPAMGVSLLAGRRIISSKILSKTLFFFLDHSWCQLLQVGFARRKCFRECSLHQRLSERHRRR